MKFDFELVHGSRKYHGAAAAMPRLPKWHQKKKKRMQTSTASF